MIPDSIIVTGLHTAAGIAVSSRNTSYHKTQKWPRVLFWLNEMGVRAVSRKR